MEDIKKNVVLYTLFFLLGFSAAHIMIPGTPPVKAVIPQIDQRTATLNFAAVSARDNTGVIGQVSVTIQKGDGSVLIDANPFIETDTQLSAKIAKEVAENYLGVSLKDYNVIYSFDVGAEILGGESAGACMAAATIAAIKGTPIKEDVVITGTISPDGRIGPVGGVGEKLIAAGEAGLDTFILPKGQATLTYYEKQETRTPIGPGFYIKGYNYIPKTLDLKNYAQEKYNMKVIEVTNIEEVMEYLL